MRRKRRGPGHAIATVITSAKDLGIGCVALQRLGCAHNPRLCLLAICGMTPHTVSAAPPCDPNARAISHTQLFISTNPSDGEVATRPCLDKSPPL